MINGLSDRMFAEEQVQKRGIRIASNNKRSNQFKNPTVQMLIENLGMSEKAAQLVVGYAAIVLRTVVQQNREPERDVKRLGTALEKLLRTDFAYQSGIASRLAKTTGLTKDEAALSLAVAVKSLNENYIMN